MSEPVILTVAPTFLPGFKAGGPIRTLTNLIVHLGDEFDFRIVTSDRDLGDEAPYPDIEPNVWINRGHSRVMYLSKDRQKVGGLKTVLAEQEYDILYLNSFFASFTIKTLLLRRLGKIPNRPTIVAPRGEFSTSALQIKWPKKRIFLHAAGLTRLYRGVIWQASSEFDAKDIDTNIARFHLDREPTILVAPNLPPGLPPSQNHETPAKSPGSARILFLSRIARMKNLDYALSRLKDVTGRVTFDIYGPIEDAAYWQTCQQIIGGLPQNIQVTYRGPAPVDQVREIFAAYHALLLPTRGENFGHVILEALSSGCPVITSNRTPWRELAKNRAGWDLPLEQPETFVGAIQQVVDMDQDEWNHWSDGAKRVAETFIHDPATIEASRQLFYTALAQNKSEL
jgi:glycosyltransferase involved in cell wall biosynthesis